VVKIAMSGVPASTIHRPSASALVMPSGIQVFERGWLSSNNVLLQGRGGCALIDSGYCTHAPQTLALVKSSLKGHALDVLVNTHLHSDHCGGNAALQAAYPQLRTLIPAGQAACVDNWNPYALTYTPTGQICPSFNYNGVLQAGAELQLGDLLWQVHAAPGHDPHSVILFELVSRTLVSADALWQRGFGVVFPELDGEQAFDDVGATLDVIEALRPRIVVPGHGAPFTDVELALNVARQRLASFVASPHKHIQYAAKVMLKFKLLEAQRMTRADLLAWARGTHNLKHLFELQFGEAPFEQGLDALVSDLVRSGAATTHAGWIHNA
jgi:glyoxylase-like metal-dependent hydrolase (beta-lactamase superfamily II)